MKTIAALLIALFSLLLNPAIAAEDSAAGECSVICSLPSDAGSGD